MTRQMTAAAVFTLLSWKLHVPVRCVSVVHLLTRDWKKFVLMEHVLLRSISALIVSTLSEESETMTILESESED